MPKKYRKYFETEDLENLVEEMVFEKLYEHASNPPQGVCVCRQCLMDIAAVVLNATPPLYSSNPIERVSPNKGFLQAIEERKKIVEDIFPEAVVKVAERAHH